MDHPDMSVSPVCLSLTLLAAQTMFAAQNPAPPATRAEQIQQERLRKSESLEPDEPDRIEKLFNRAMETVPKLTRLGPVEFASGGADSGEGFALGPVVTLKNSKDSFRFAVSATGSTAGSYAMRTGIYLPSAANRQLPISLEAAHSNSPRLEFYGSGADSLKGDRTNYRREDTSITAAVAWKPHHRRWTAGILSGPLFVNVGRGTWRGISPTESKFTPVEAPGIDIQTNFLRTTIYGDLDFRDLPGDPRAGSRFTASYSQHTDLKRDRYSFGIVAASAEHYISLLNRKRVLGLRARTEIARHASGQLVPFYMQPTLGGPSDLSGFRQHRFSGNSLVAMAAEYRWEVGTGVDMALFADAGKVFERARDIRLKGLERSAGFGIRVRSREAVVFRLDTGFSREGFQIWMRFDTGLEQSF
jgi:hypothetical protein